MECQVLFCYLNTFLVQIEKSLFSVIWTNFCFLEWIICQSSGNRTSKDQRPRGESEEARWDGEENWAAAKPKWTKLSIWWSGLVAFGWPSSCAELSWWKLYFVVSGQLCCLGKLYGLNSTFWIVIWILECYCFAELSCEFWINLVIMAVMWILDQSCFD